MSYSDCLETQRLTLVNKGKACIKCTCTFEYKTVTMCADLRLTGNLNGNPPTDALCGCLRPTQLVVKDLVGFWEMWGDDDENFKFASYNPITGRRISIPSTQIPAEGTRSGQHQFNQGKNPDSFVYFSKHDNGDWSIANFNTNTNRIEYLSINPPNDEWLAIVYDPILDRYLGWEYADQALYSFDPLTGAETMLSNLGILGENAIDSIIINNTIFFAINNTNTISLSRFDRSTGTPLGNIIWTGSYQFSGTNFIDLINLEILGMGLDQSNSTLYLLLQNDQSRYLGFVSTSSLGELETLISSGNFDITMCQCVPTDKLEALLYLN